MGRSRRCLLGRTFFETTQGHVLESALKNMLSTESTLRAARVTYQEADIKQRLETYSAIVCEGTTPRKILHLPKVGHMAAHKHEVKCGIGSDIHMPKYRHMRGTNTSTTKNHQLSFRFSSSSCPHTKLLHRRTQPHHQTTTSHLLH